MKADLLPIDRTSQKASLVSQAFEDVSSKAKANLFSKLQALYLFGGGSGFASGLRLPSLRITNKVFGSGIFGESGLVIKGNKINALYSNPNVGGVTLFSFQNAVKFKSVTRVFKLDLHRVYNKSLGRYNQILHTHNAKRLQGMSNRQWRILVEGSAKPLLKLPNF